MDGAQPGPRAVRPESVLTVDPRDLVFGKRTAAYVCTGCGIGECLDAERLAQTAERDGVPAKVHGPLCIPGGVEFLRTDIAEQGAERAVIAACSPRVNWDVFSDESLGVELVERVNVRELVAWSKPPREEETQLLAEDYLRMGIAHSGRTAPPPKRPVEVEATILVVGGGIAGITAALEAAGAGHDVILLERQERLGGWLARFHKTFPTSAPYDELRAIVVDERIRALEAHPRVTVHTAAEVERIEGMPGDYRVTVVRGPDTIRFRAGAIVVATGWRPQLDGDGLGRLGYGRNPNVIANVMFEGMAKDGRLVRPSDGRPAKRVAFVQRPGMSAEQKTFSYGANLVDIVSLKHALYVRELDPEAQAYIFYEGIVTPGLYEDFYRRVQEEPGVFFTKGDVAEVHTSRDGAPVVEVEHTLLGDRVSLPCDLVVLGAGMAPTSATEDEAGALHLAYRQGAGLPTAKFGFSSSNFICFPYETGRTGIYAAGGVREPLDADAAAEDATGAALKAIQSLELIRRGEAVHPRVRDLSLPHTRKSGCTQCHRCLAECPFSAIEMDELRFPRLNPTRCRRCGICMGACPVQVISFEDYSVDQLSAMVRAIEPAPPDERALRILALVCENDAYPAFDLAGINRVSFDAAVRVVPIRCFGSLNHAVVANALAGGIDGVMLMGCRTGEDYQCHMIRGSELARRRMENLRETLSRLGLEPGRVKPLEIEISAYCELPDLIAEFVEELGAMEPNPFKAVAPV